MDAPGQPGIAPRWTSSDKSGIGTALKAQSRVWFTLSHGIVNECYFPRVDQACTRDFGLIVTDGDHFFAEEKRDTENTVTTIEDGVPAYELINEHARFTITKRIITDPRRDTLLQQIRLERRSGPPLRLFALLAPHLVNGGADNTGWVGDFKGQPMLFAEGSGTALALAASVPMGTRSVGYVGTSDAWQDLSRHFRMQWEYPHAGPGNIALAVELANPEDGPIVLALGFGGTWSEAAFRARASLGDTFEALAEEYASNWREWQQELRPLDRIAGMHNTYRVSTAVVRSHEAPSFPGGYIASLSIPWGASMGDDNLGGYHLVWPRDLVETAGGLLAAGGHRAALRILTYLRTIQEPDGHWGQNNWLEGTPYWGGLQLDECAFPILLADLALREGALIEQSAALFWPMVRAAAGFVARTGPVTQQDRWEENGGFSTFTLAVEIAALLAAAEWADRANDAPAAAFLRDTADWWNAELDAWVYATGSKLAEVAGVPGYYIRMAPDRAPLAESDTTAQVLVKNRADGQGYFVARDIVSADAFALVRFGLRAATDPRVQATIAAVDRCTRVDLPQGPCWYRYNRDGYGEHDDGRPFDGTGRGRLWPLLTGERAHVALAAGRRAEAEALLETMEASTSRGALIPEQIWDADDIPERELFRGQPSGSAMPLVWAHAEHIKLLRSLADGRIFDLPPQPVARYQAKRPATARAVIWRPDFQAVRATKGQVLIVALPHPATVRWSADAWSTSTDTATVPLSLGLHIVELPASTAGWVFTWHGDEGWAGRNYTVAGG